MEYEIQVPCHHNSLDSVLPADFSLPFVSISVMMLPWHPSIYSLLQLQDIILTF